MSRNSSCSSNSPLRATSVYDITAASYKSAGGGGRVCVWEEVGGWSGGVCEYGRRWEGGSGVGVCMGGTSTFKFSYHTGHHTLVSAPPINLP